MPGAYEIVMRERRLLVDKIIEMMKKDSFFNNKAEWARDALRPQNPLSQVCYRGGNRIRLMAAVIENGYRDPRWATARQYGDKGYRIRKGEHGVVCEKWIFEKLEKRKDERGNTVLEMVELKHPQVSYFRVFNAMQVEDFPVYTPPDREQTSLNGMIDQMIATSECPIKEAAQERAFYSLTEDQIVLPPREVFKDDTSFAKTLIHEMSHSTGAPLRLNRPMGAPFGSEEYAKEELRAEIGALFTETDLGISLAGEHYEDHSDYLRSWIHVLKDDYNEFFRACADAEKIAGRLTQNYIRKYGEILPKMNETIPENKKIQSEIVEIKKTKGVY